MEKYKLLKDLPLAKAGTEIELQIAYGNNYSIITFVNHFNQKMSAGEIMNKDIPEWLEPIVEKKTYDDLKEGDTIFFIDTNGDIDATKFDGPEISSETFLTREEAEDEHKRREWSCRKNKFIPKEDEEYWYATNDLDATFTRNYYSACDYLIINQGLAFRTSEECQKAIKEHDLIRLFYTIR